MIQHPTVEALSLTGCGIIEAMGIAARSCGMDQTWQLRPGHEAWGLALGYRAELRRAGLRAMPCGVIRGDDSRWMLVPVRVRPSGLDLEERPESPHELTLVMAGGIHPDAPPWTERSWGGNRTITPAELAKAVDRMRGSARCTLDVRAGPRLAGIYGEGAAHRAVAEMLREVARLPGEPLALAAA